MKYQPRKNLKNSLKSKGKKNLLMVSMSIVLMKRVGKISLIGELMPRSI